MKKNVVATGKLSLNKKVILKLGNKTVTCKPEDHLKTVPTTFPTTITGLFTCK